MEYNFRIQRQVTPNITSTVNYVGSESRHLFIQPVYNAPLPSEMGPGALAPRTPYPFLGQFPYDTNSGVSNYNALEAKLVRRFSQSLTFLTSYTWSHCLDIQSEGQSGSIQNPYDWSADYGPCDFDFPNIFVFSSTYVLPFGRGMHFGSSWNGWKNAALGGWQMSGIANLTSGTPFSVAVGFDNANIHPSSETERAELVGNPLTSGFQQNIQHWYNTAAFAVPAPYTLGNLGRNTLRRPSSKDVDFPLAKNFRLAESKTLQFRTDFFDLFNFVNFENPNAAVSSPNFMKIFGAGSPREIQFALKFLF